MVCKVFCRIDETDFPSDNMYTIELPNGNTIRCTEQYFTKVEEVAKMIDIQKNSREVIRVSV